MGDRGSDVPHQETSTMFLPAFVSLLREAGVLEIPLESGDSCCELYNWARYRDGVSTFVTCNCGDHYLLYCLIFTQVNKILFTHLSLACGHLVYMHIVVMFLDFTVISS